MLLRREKDVKVIGVLVDVEKDTLGVTSVVTDALDGRGVKMPAVQTSTVIVLVFVVKWDRCLIKHNSRKLSVNRIYTWEEPRSTAVEALQHFEPVRVKTQLS